VSQGFSSWTRLILRFEEQEQEKVKVLRSREVEWGRPKSTFGRAGTGVSPGSRSFGWIVSKVGITGTEVSRRFEDQG